MYGVSLLQHGDGMGIPIYLCAMSQHCHVTVWADLLHTCAMSQCCHMVVSACLLIYMLLLLEARELKNDVRKENSMKRVLETSAGRSDFVLLKQLAHSHTCQK